LQVAPPSAGPAAAPDAVVYVAATKELWVTTGAPPIGVPAADKAIQVFDVSKPREVKLKTKIPLDGSAEGYAVDNQRGVFYTNIEEAGKTVAIDVRSHKVVNTWRVHDDLQGLALDSARGFLFCLWRPCCKPRCRSRRTCSRLSGHRRRFGQHRFFE